MEQDKASRDFEGIKGVIERAKQSREKNLLLDFAHLREMPPSIAELTELECLDFLCYQVSDISFLKNLTGLRSLYLGHTKTSDFRVLGSLTWLEDLSLEGYEISDISFLSSLIGLKTLNLNRLGISDISALSRLEGLELLSLGGNNISDISPLYGLIRNGLHVHFDYQRSGIVLKDNPITTPPLSIVKEGREAILNYFDQIKKQGESPLYEAKLMILGQGGAGKTTFARLQMDPAYDLKAGDPGSTLGIEIHEGITFDHQEVEQQKIDTRLWDFGGQDIQKMLHQFFITEDCLYVLVCDKRKENTDFDYWFQIINLLGPGSPVIVLENQTGAVGNNERFALNKYQGLFKGLSLETEEVNLAWTRVGHKGRWKKLNELIAEKLSELEIVNRDVPAKWPLIRKRLAKLQEKKYLGIDEYLRLCKEKEIGLDKEQARLCLNYLKALGDLVYFEDHDLEEYIFLDHNWLTEGVYFILTDERIEKNKGRFTKQQAKENWEKHNYSESEKSMLLRLMLKNQFDLCYEVEEGVFITPLLLPNDRPKNLKPIEADLYFRFQYGFMPHGMFSRAIVRFHERIDGQKRWKSGVILKDQATGAQAEVLQFNDPDDNQQVIDIKVNGTKAGRKSLLDFVRTNIEHLHKEFKNLNVQRKVGCNCKKCEELKSRDDKPTFYDYKELQSMLQNRVYFVRCSNDNYNAVNIGQILSNVITEDAGEKSSDNELLYRLKEMGMSINLIKNEAKVDMAGARIGGDAKSKSSASSKATAKAKSEAHIQIQNLLGHTGMIKDRIARDLKIKGENPEEIAYALSDVDMAEEALKEIEAAQAEGKEPEPKSKSMLGEFIEDLSNEESTIHKTLKKLRKGRDYGVKLAETYNKIAGNFAMPLVPPAALELIKKI